MKLRIIKLFIITVFIFTVSAVIAAPENKTGLREFGRVLFINETSSEVMVFSDMKTPSLFITAGSVLQIGKSDKPQKIRVTDICNSYIRCFVLKRDDKSLFPFKEGDTVFISDSSNENIKYNDVKIALSALIKTYEDFIFRIESVEEPAVIADYIDRFTSELEKMIPEMERLNSKYPELLKFFSEPPVELKFESETLKLLEPALKNAFFKINIYAEDPVVKKSIEKLYKVIEKMKVAGK